MSKHIARKQYRCELCDGLVSANAYTPCCGKLLCAACAQGFALSGVAGTPCPICQTSQVETMRHALSSPAPDGWLEEDYEWRVSGYSEWLEEDEWQVRGYDE
jgi:hypothetical protein